MSNGRAVRRSVERFYLENKGKKVKARTIGRSVKPKKKRSKIQGAIDRGHKKLMAFLIGRTG